MDGKECGKVSAGGTVAKGSEKVGRV